MLLIIRDYILVGTIFFIYFFDKVGYLGRCLRGQINQYSL